MKKLLSAAKLMLTLKCEQSTRIVSESLDRKLSPVERWAVRLHYVSCWSCRRFGKQLRMMARRIATPSGTDFRRRAIVTGGDAADRRSDSKRALVFSGIDEVN